MRILVPVLALSVAVCSLSAPAFARHGADDGKGDVRQSRGKDDGVGHTELKSIPLIIEARRGRGADDPAGHIRRGRGADDPAGDDRGGRRSRA